MVSRVPASSERSSMEGDNDCSIGNGGDHVMSESSSNGMRDGGHHGTNSGRHNGVNGH